MSKPTDTEIIGLLKSKHGELMPTYYIKNCLRDASPRLQTPWVLRRLKALEKAGLARRAVRQPYATMICWEAVPAVKEGSESNG